MRRLVIDVKMRVGLLASLMVLVVPCFADLISAPNVGSAASFGMLSGGAISDSGVSVVNGDVGGVASVTGFPPGTVTAGHTIYPSGNATVIQAVTDFHNAIFAPGGAFFEAPTDPFSTGSINATTTFLGDNVYRLGDPTTGDLNITSPSVLTFSGNSTDVFIIQVVRSLTVGGAGAPILSGGALPQNIFWVIGGTATLSTPMTWDGSLFVQTSFTMSQVGTINGCVFTDAANGSNTLAEATYITGGCQSLSAPGGVPEPGTVGLLGTGLVGLIFLGRRSRRRAA